MILYGQGDGRITETKTFFCHSRFITKTGLLKDKVKESIDAVFSPRHDILRQRLAVNRQSRCYMSDQIICLLNTARFVPSLPWIYVGRKKTDWRLDYIAEYLCWHGPEYNLHLPMPLEYLKPRHFPNLSTKWPINFVSPFTAMTSQPCGVSHTTDLLDFIVN